MGTIVARRLSFADYVTERRRPRPAEIERGATRFAVANICLQLTVLIWWDNKPKQILATGGSREMETCGTP